MDADKHRSRNFYWRLWEQVRPAGGCLGAMFLLSLLSPPLALLTPLPLKLAVDNVIGSRPLPRWVEALLPAAVPRSPAATLALAVGLVVAVAFVSQLRDFGNSLLSAYAGEKLLRGFRAQLFRHVQRLSLAYHDTRGTADSTYRIQYDATSIQHIAVDGIVPFIASGLTLASMIYVSARINWKLALVGWRFRR